MPDAGRDAAPPDAGLDVTAEAASDSGTCTDGIKNGSETDVDCGGGVCPKCKDGNTCVVATDCTTNTCSAGVCGTRAWSAESNGSNVTIPGNQTWVDASGLDLQPNLYAGGLVLLRWTGTVRFAGGGNGLCHVGQRFLVDDVPTGDPNWGDSIMVMNGATRWHETFTTETAVSMVSGLHTVSVQMTNANGFGTCYLDGDMGAAYDRSRLAVSVHDPKNAWFAESTGDTGAVVPSAGFVAIPGVSTTINLATDRHVQMSLTGTQYSVGTASAYCGYRLVIDSVPLGDATWGQALVVGDTVSGWWGPVAVKYGQDMKAGSHTIAAQMTSQSGTATCDAGQGNNPYARFRLLVTASPVGGPNVSVESSGGADILGSTSVWTPVGGLSTSFTVSAPTQVQLEMAATEETVSGTSGHCSWHFVIDGLPLGDTSYGQAINVGSTATTWWTPTALLWGQQVDTGNHTVSVEVRNSSSSGDCGTNGDGLPYGRARLLIRAP